MTCRIILVVRRLRRLVLRGRRLILVLMLSVGFVSRLLSIRLRILVRVVMRLWLRLSAILLGWVRCRFIRLVRRRLLSRVSVCVISLVRILILVSLMMRRRRMV